MRRPSSWNAVALFVAPSRPSYEADAVTPRRIPDGSVGLAELSAEPAPRRGPWASGPAAELAYLDDAGLGAGR
jgi:hypothetical protein